MSAVDIYPSSGLSTVTYNMILAPRRACVRTWGSVMVSEEAPPGAHSWQGREHGRVRAMLVLTVKPGTGSLGRNFLSRVVRRAEWDSKGRDLILRLPYRVGAVR